MGSSPSPSEPLCLSSHPSWPSTPSSHLIHSYMHLPLIRETVILRTDEVCRHTKTKISACCSVPLVGDRWLEIQTELSLVSVLILLLSLWMLCCHQPSLIPSHPSHNLHCGFSVFYQIVNQLVCQSMCQSVSLPINHQLLL